MSDPDVIADRERYAEVGREYRALGPARALAGEYATLADDLEGARELIADDPEDEELQVGRLRGAGEARGARRADPPGDGRAGSQRRQERARRDPRRRRRRRGRPVRRRPLLDADPLRGGLRLSDRGPLPEPCRGRRLQGRDVRRSRATAPTRCSNSRAAPTGSSAFRRPSPRAASTPRRRPSPSCRKRRRSMSRSIPTISRWTSTAPRARAGSRSTRPIRPSGSPTSRAGSSSPCRTRSRSFRTRTRRCGCSGPGCSSTRSPTSRPSYRPSAAPRSEPVIAPRRSAPTTIPQGRVTDHRIKHTSHNLEEVLGGSLGEFTEALAAEEKRARLEAQTAGAE